jgi:hypothetical protein
VTARLEASVEPLPKLCMAGFKSKPSRARACRYKYRHRPCTTIRVSPRGEMGLQGGQGGQGTN